MQGEIDVLGAVFRDIYGFETETWSIPHHNAHRLLQRKISHFEEDHSDPAVLLIVHYGGHGALEEYNRSVWTEYAGSSLLEILILTVFVGARTPQALLWNGSASNRCLRTVQVMLSCFLIAATQCQPTSHRSVAVLKCYQPVDENIPRLNQATGPSVKHSVECLNSSVTDHSPWLSSMLVSSTFVLPLSIRNYSTRRSIMQTILRSAALELLP